MNLKSILDMLKSGAKSASKHPDGVWVLSGETLKDWAETIEQHIAVAKEVTCPATWIDDAIKSIEDEMGQMQALIQYLNGLSQARQRRWSENHDR